MQNVKLGINRKRRNKNMAFIELCLLILDSTMQDTRKLVYDVDGCCNSFLRGHVVSITFSLFFLLS